MATDIQLLVEQYGLSGKKSEALKAVGDKVAGWLDEVLEVFYADLATREDFRRFFPNDDVLRHARAKQKQHWQQLLSGKFDTEYVASARRIGRVHFFKIDLPLDYYMAGYAQASAHIQALFVQNASLWARPTQKAKLAEGLGLLSRAFFLDMNLVIDSFFEAQHQEQETAFGYLREGMGRMARKDFSKAIPAPATSDFPARFEEVRLAFNSLQSDMGGVIRTIKHATDDLDLTAAEVNSSADDLAHRTETQAATLEQTALSVEEITKSVLSSSEATQQTDSMMAQTHKSAVMGKDVMSETVAKMREIAESSAQISQITGVIDDIAFQTNLLALNAGVEAARAGDAGRGFAVVAHEVRGLAQRAADSAAEISELIKASSDLVENGVTLVDQAGDVLDGIVQSVEKVATLTSKVANSSREQSEGLGQISSGLSQLDSVTQQNAAMVEQTAAAMGSMQRDTTQMAQLVRDFDLTERPSEGDVQLFTSRRVA